METGVPVSPWAYWYAVSRSAWASTATCHAFIAGAGTASRDWQRQGDRTPLSGWWTGLTPTSPVIVVEPVFVMVPGQHREARGLPRFTGAAARTDALNRGRPATRRGATPSAWRRVRSGASVQRSSLPPLDCSGPRQPRLGGEGVIAVRDDRASRQAPTHYGPSHRSARCCRASGVGVAPPRAERHSAAFGSGSCPRGGQGSQAGLTWTGSGILTPRPSSTSA